MNRPPLCAASLVENGRVMVATLTRPAKNTLDPDMLSDLGEAIDAFQAGGGPEILILTGGGSVFSHGFDVDCVRAYPTPAEHRASLLACNDVCSRLAESHKLTIAAINGHCLGAGLELALACHLRFCAERARLGLPELARGLIPGLGGIHRLVRVVGRAKALEWIAVGDVVTASDALGAGLVNRVLPRAEFMDHVLAFARAVLLADPALVREVVRLTASAEVQSDQDSVLQTVERAVACARTAPLR